MCGRGANKPLVSASVRPTGKHAGQLAKPKEMPQPSETRHLTGQQDGMGKYGGNASGQIEASAGGTNETSALITNRCHPASKPVATEESGRPMVGAEKQGRISGQDQR